MKNYDENKESSYIQYLDTNNLYGWAMSQKLPVNGFKWINDVTEINAEFIKNYDENSDKGYILEVDAKYKKKLHDLHIDLTFLPKRMKIDKCKKLVCTAHFFLLRKFAIKKMRRTYEIIKASTKSWIKIYKSS